MIINWSENNNQSSKFRLKSWVKANDESREKYW